MAVYRKHKKKKSSAGIWAVTLLFALVLIAGALLVKKGRPDKTGPGESLGQDEIPMPEKTNALSIVPNTGWVNDPKDHNIRQCSSSTETKSYYLHWRADTSRDVYYVDLETMQGRTACPKPDCPHQDSSCPALHSSGFDLDNLIVINNQLYAVQRHAVRKHGPQIVRLNEDGSICEIVAELPIGTEILIDWQNENAGFFTDGEFLYFGLREVDAPSNSAENAQIVKASLANGEVSKLTDFTDTTSVAIQGAQGRTVVYWSILPNAEYRFGTVNVDTKEMQELQYREGPDGTFAFQNGCYGVDASGNLLETLQVTDFASGEQFEINLKQAVDGVDFGGVSGVYIQMIPFDNRHGIVQLNGRPEIIIDFENRTAEPFTSEMFICKDTTPYGWLMNKGTEETPIWALITPENYWHSKNEYAAKGN